MGHFVWDETAYLLLDIGFIWNIYLDGEMGLVQQTLAMTSFVRRSARISKRSLDWSPLPVPRRSVADFSKRMTQGAWSSIVKPEVSILKRQQKVAR